MKPRSQESEDSSLPSIAVTDEVGEGRLRSAALQGVSLKRPMGVAHRRDKYFSLAVSAFVAELLDHTRSLSQAARGVGK